MGLQWGERGETVSANFRMFYFYFWFYGVDIIPKWLIKVPGHIPILYKLFMVLPKSWFFWTRSRPLHLLFITKTLQKIQEHMATSLNNILLSYFNFLELRTFLKFGPTEPKNILIFVEEFPPQQDWCFSRFLKDFFHNTFWKILRDQLFWQNAKS